MHLIYKIHPPSSNLHRFIAVATDYFNNWVDIMPAKAINQAYVIKFINEHIIHRFSLPKSIMVDQGLVFTGVDVKAFANNQGIKILNPTPYFA